MLRVSIHARLLAERTPFNQIGTLDIGYHARGAKADYIGALQLMHRGELEPAFVRQYQCEATTSSPCAQETWLTHPRRGCFGPSAS